MDSSPAKRPTLTPRAAKALIQTSFGALVGLLVWTGWLTPFLAAWLLLWQLLDGPLLVIGGIAVAVSGVLLACGLATPFQAAAMAACFLFGKWLVDWGQRRPSMPKN